MHHIFTHILARTLNSSIVALGMTVETVAMFALSDVWMRLCWMESPLQEMVWKVC